jgi:nucleoid-associated protein EbfC
MMKGGLAGLMKQAQQMQNNMKKAQEELATIEVEGQAGSGMVKVTMTCNHEVRRVQLDDSLLSDDKEMLEDLIVTALNDAGKQVAEVTQQKMSGFTSGMNLPPGMSLPF